MASFSNKILGNSATHDLFVFNSPLEITRYLHANNVDTVTDNDVVEIAILIYEKLIKTVIQDVKYISDQAMKTSVDRNDAIANLARKYASTY